MHRFPKQGPLEHHFGKGAVDRHLLYGDLQDRPGNLGYDLHRASYQIAGNLFPFCNGIGPDTPFLPRSACRAKDTDNPFTAREPGVLMDPATATELTGG